MSSCKILKLLMASAHKSSSSEILRIAIHPCSSISLVSAPHPNPVPFALKLKGLLGILPIPPNLPWGSKKHREGASELYPDPVGLDAQEQEEA